MLSVIMGSVIATASAVVVSILSLRPSDVIYWYKFIISYIYVYFQRKSTKSRFISTEENFDNDPYKVDFISLPEEIALESPVDERNLYNAVDGIFCYGINSKSECLVTKITRFRNERALAMIYLKLSNGKVYELKETYGYQQSCCEKKAFTCGDLQMHYITPMRKWRIFYNGLLRERDENNSELENMVHVKFAFLWSASSDVFDYSYDINAETVARSMAKAKWKGIVPPLEKFNKMLKSYAQCGTLNGTVTVEDSEEENIIYLFGERLRLLGDTTPISKLNFFNLLGQVQKDGTFIHLSKSSFEYIVKDLTFGFLVKPNGQMFTINDENIIFENLTSKDGSETGMKATFHIDDISYVLNGNLEGRRVNFQIGKDLEGPVNLHLCKFKLNETDCSGILLKGAVSMPYKQVTYQSPVYKTPSVVPFVLQFSDKLCQDSVITGGKGSSLGKLTELSKEFQTFIVPNGIVVTTLAYEKFLTQNITKMIKELEDVIYGNITGDDKEACQRVVDGIIDSEIPNEVEAEIVNFLQKAFPEKGFLQFAIRSSATGEDTEQMSAAGQMETFLGVTGTSDILSAVKKCWASQFSYIAVQYKRQNGQIINSPMAVVIQKMIPCDVAGVLFTCDPLTGNPTVMSITANYGLGESVVSASEEPDTIEIKRDFNDKLAIKNKIIGAKSHRIILQDEKGTDIVDVAEDDRNSCCLSDEMALRLGTLATKIEKSYRSHRDIEWGYWNNNLYIFQSRPVTSGTGESDFEIDHESDGSLRIENDYFSVHNVGEVMPGALSPLGLDILMKYFRIAFMTRMQTSWQSKFKPRYFPKVITSFYYHVMFNCVDLLERMDENKDASDGTLVALFGRVVEDDELFQTVRNRFGNKKKSWLSTLQLFIMIYRLFLSRKIFRKMSEKYSNYDIPLDKFKTSHKLFDALLHVCTDLNEPMGSHMMNSESSTIWTMFIFSILKKARGGFNSEVYRDLAVMLTTHSDVESADVPAGIERLAFHIAKEIPPEEFKKMEVKAITDWLEKSQSVAGTKYREFLKKHGHRCLKEFDFRLKTWGTDQTTLIELLKNLVENTSKTMENKTNKSIDEIISDLKLPIGFIARSLLKYFIPQSRQAVQNREGSKSILVKCKNAWRKGYHKLAKMMVSEGRIPDEDLLFFMTLDEIKELLETRSPKILARANHRRRRYPNLDRYLFPEIMKGFPEPINMEDSTAMSSDENFSMKGIPVSQGVVKAYVRVALTLEEASHLQPGEILLTYSTDIGWSPYFPMLGGVVTELGGLISHGAVVSREYGLPCIAGLHGATRQFKTGDYVLLDGNKGLLQKLPIPESPETS